VPGKHSTLAIRTPPCLPHMGTSRWLVRKAEQVSDLSSRADIIALSVFWHDVVYRTQNHDGTPRTDYENVRDSAGLFRQYTLLNQLDADAVYDLIMATASHLQARAEKQYYAGLLAISISSWIWI